MRRLPIPALVLLALAAGPVAAQEAPPLAQVVKYFDAKTGKQLDLDALLDALAKYEMVFFGETHLDETTHRLELAVYEGLIERTKGKVVLAMEMFERDTQPALDAYLQGEIAEPEFRRRARAWGNYLTGYRPLVEAAKKRGLPVVASNAPSMLRRRVGFRGPEELEKLTPEERALLPEKLYPNTEAYWERFARVVRGHMNMIAGSTPERRLTSGQSLWDNTMGESCVKALAKYPGHVILHINGGFHSRDREGAVTQVLVRRPETKLAVLDATPVDDLPGVSEWKDEKRADFFAACDARARGLSEGFHAVRISPELRYRIAQLPPAAAEGNDVPLLIWLGDDPFRAEDGVRLWSRALGEEAVIAVIEPPYPHLAPDLYVGGHWYWPETFNQDIGTLESGIAAIYGYLLRNFPIDPKRVVIAGEGTGATIVAAAGVYSGLEHPMLAFAPRRYHKLHGLALPDPREIQRTLTVVTGESDWWENEAAEHASVGRTTKVVAAPATGWELFVDAETRIRAALGLDARPSPEGDETVLVLETDTPRARAWAFQLARDLEAKGQRAKVVAEGEGVVLACLGEAEGAAFTPRGLAHAHGIPLAAGPFGGTTVLLVPKGRSDADRAAWQALEDEKILSRRSRFARLRVVFEGDESDNLRAALQEVKDKGRTTVLVVPAVYCATGDQMRRWAAEAEEFADVLDIAWKPGLGGSAKLAGPVK
jgi:uncharacterized iron-regulated protein